MKRDFDLIRKLLLAIEAADSGILHAIPVIDGYSEDQVGYHAHLMHEAGLITAADASPMSGPPCAIPGSLTWAGHDFLDAARDETIWHKAGTEVLRPAMSLSFDLLLEWLKAEARRHLGL